MHQEKRGLSNFISHLIIASHSSPTPTTSPKVRTNVPAYADVITKFSGIDRFPFSFSYGAPLARAREAPLKRGAGNESWEQESEKWEQNSELEMKLLVELKFKLGFVIVSFLFYFLFIFLSFIITQKINHNIAGPLCFSGDVIKRNILLPKVL